MFWEKKPKASAATMETGEGDLFVLVIDRDKIIKQLLEAMPDLGLPFRK